MALVAATAKRAHLMGTAFSFCFLTRRYILNVET